MQLFRQRLIITKFIYHFSNYLDIHLWALVQDEDELGGKALDEGDGWSGDVVLDRSVEDIICSRLSPLLFSITSHLKKLLLIKG